MTSARLAALAVATREVGKTIQFERGLSDEVAITCAVVIDRAADVVAEHERVEALRRLLPCPTCGGTGWVVNDDTGYTVHAGYKCNECPDGFMPWERIVFVTRNAMTASPDGFADAESVLLHLRAVRPAGETSGR